jgi:SOS-response transcriptional repressor LexA
VALLPNGETTLKTYFKESDHIRLQPAGLQGTEDEVALERGIRRGRKVLQ